MLWVKGFELGLSLMFEVFIVFLKLKSRLWILGIDCVIEWVYDVYGLRYGLVEAWNWFWGLGIDLVCFGKVLARRKRSRKPRNLGLRRRAATQLFRAAARSPCLMGAAAQESCAAAQGKFQVDIFGNFRPLLRGFGGCLRGVVLRF